MRGRLAHQVLDELSAIPADAPEPPRELLGDQDLSDVRRERIRGSAVDGVALIDTEEVLARRHEVHVLRRGEPEVPAGHRAGGVDGVERAFTFGGGQNRACPGSVSRGIVGDGHHSFEEAPKLLGALAAGADVAVGSRWLQRELQTVRQPGYRQIFGRVFNLYLRAVLGLNFRDTQCGFKAFKREAAHAIFSRQQTRRWGFDPEVLYLCRRLGYRSVEIPVLWAHDRRTRISYFRDGMKMVLEVLKVRWNALLGRYNQPSHAVVAQQVGVAR